MICKNILLLHVIVVGRVYVASRVMLFVYIYVVVFVRLLVASALINCRCLFVS